MNEQNINVQDLFKIIQGLQLQLTENNLLIQELNLRIETLTAPKVRTPREPKVLCSLLPRSHYLIPFDLITSEILEHVINIVDNPDNSDVTSQWETNKGFITSLLQQGIPVWHYGNGKLAIHRFGQVKFKLSDLGITEDQLKSFNQLKDLEKGYRKECKEALRVQEVQSRIIWKSDAVKEQVLSRKFVDETEEN